MDWVTTSTILEGLKDYERGEAWERLVGRFRRPIVAFARELGLPESDAEDVAQETLVAFADAYRAGKYDPSRGRLNKWLFGIAYRQAQRERRRRARRGAAQHAPTDGTALLEQVPDEARATAIWEQRWEEALLHECMRQARLEVEPRTYQAFELTVRDDRSAAEVAAALDLPVKAVYNAKHRVLKRIRELRDQYEQMA